MTSIPVCYYADIILLPRKVLKANRDIVTQNTKTYLHFKSHSLWTTQQKKGRKTNIKLLFFQNTRPGLWGDDLSLFFTASSPTLKTWSFWILIKHHGASHGIGRTLAKKVPLIYALLCCFCLTLNSTIRTPWWWICWQGNSSCFLIKMQLVIGCIMFLVKHVWNAILEKQPAQIGK